jgi:hypothetical protein
MKSITTQELLRLAQVQNPKTELDKMSYAEISAVQDRLEKIIHLTRDCRLFSILLEFKHNLVICEESKRQKELEQIKELSSLEEILSYIAHAEQKEMVIYV